MKLLFLFASLQLLTRHVQATCKKEIILEVSIIKCDQILSLDDVILDVSNSTSSRLTIQDSTLKITKTEIFNPTNLTELKIILCNITSMEASFFSKFSALRQIIIVDSYIGAIEAFPMTTMWGVYFGGNTFEYIPTNLFHNLVNLWTLTLNENEVLKSKDETFISFQHLPSHVFKNMPVNYINLEGNEIITMETNTFESLNELVYLELQNNLIENLQAGTFKDLKKVRELNLSTNKIKNFNDKMFVGLSALETLTLSNNELTYISKSLHAPSINILDVSFNKITSIEIYLENLTLLILSNNQLISLEESAFKGVPNLTVLDVSYNFIDTISSDTFKHTPNLTTLNLQSNKISSLTNKIFSYFNNFTTLILSYNHIVNLNEIQMDNLDKLLYLNLFNNELKQIKSDTFKNLKLLKELDLHSTRLTNLTATAFNGLANLKKLNVSSNKLEKLGDSLFKQLINLEILNLGDANLNELKSVEFKGLHKLNTIYLDNNKLTSLPVGIFNGLKIVDLSLKGNDIKYLNRDVFANQSKITYINLENTPIQSLEETDVIPQLEYLLLSGTKFENQTFIQIKERKFRKINDRYWSSWCPDFIEICK